MSHTPRHIAPRLASGERRVPASGALPAHIKHALRMIAAARGESLSWTMEQVWYEHFGFKIPDYRGARTATAVTVPKRARALARAS